MNRRNRILASGFVLLCLALILIVFKDRILWSAGNLLVNAGPPQKTDIVVVIGGDFLGNRILKGGELVRQGYAPKVLASGSGTMYGNLEADLATDFAVRHGYPREFFTSLHYAALSTFDEAAAVTKELHALGVHKYTLITSDYHTARAARIFRHAAPDLEIHTVAAPDPYWDNGYWWKLREGRKLWFYETVKTVTEYFGA
jgi:uncharacterized SAM-binding protein YcdF (DUF218 family)